MPLASLNDEIVSCNKCKRLREWCLTREGENPQYLDENYWGLPVPGFGDSNGKIMIVGLAPGAHGANRTGRVFTGDTAGDYLFRSLYKFGFSNSGISRRRDDGLALKEVYISNAVRCAPPKNLPTKDEILSCKAYLKREINALVNLKVILVLGEKAFDQVKSVLSEFGLSTKGKKFAHSKVYRFDGSDLVIVASYHTSKYNIDTKRMSLEKLNKVFNQVQEIVTNESTFSKF